MDYKDDHLCFFDSDDKYPYLVRRYRKFDDSVDETPSGTKLDQFLNRQKRVSEFDFAKKRSRRNLETIKEGVGNSKGTKKKFSHIAQALEEDQGIEDDNKFLFEEAKFSATNVILQLGKLLDIVAERRQEAEENTVQPVSSSILHQTTRSADSIVLRRGSTDIIWKFNNNPSSECLLVEHKGLGFYPSEAIIDLLNISYQDLIKNAQYYAREWQTHTYKHIADSNPKGVESGIFSAPQTAMSGMISNEDGGNKVKKTKTKPNLTSSNNALTSANASSSPSKIYGASSMNLAPDAGKQRTRRLTKQKTRIEKFNMLGKEIHETPSKKKDKEKDKDKDKDSSDTSPKKDDVDLDDVPAPPINQAMINFAISSRICHEKGWVMQPSMLEDPEHHTLLHWARERLQEAIRKRVKEEQESYSKNLQEITRRYYGDGKRDVIMKSKHLSKKMADKVEEKKKKFMTILPDGTQNVYYPNGHLAVTCVSCPNTKRHYVLVYSDTKRVERKLLAHFTPSGRGVCYHSNGQIAFISMSKFGCCHAEDGALIDKWKWSMHKIVPPLTFQLTPYITFRCSNKTMMSLFVNINGENVRFQLGTKEDVPDPNLNEMGRLMTMEKFTSNIGIQLSRNLQTKIRERKHTRAPKKLQEIKQQHNHSHHKDPLHPGSKLFPTKSTSATNADHHHHAVKKYSGHDQHHPEHYEQEEMSLEERLKGIEIKFPGAPKEFKEPEIMPTPYQVDLKTLQTKFKKTASEWLDHYRVATGISQPSRVNKQNRQRPSTCFPFSSKTSTMFMQRKKGTARAPSAPPQTLRDRSTSRTISRVHEMSSRLHDRPDTSIGARRNFSKVSFVSAATSGRRSTSPDSAIGGSTAPFKCGLLQQQSKITKILPKDGCPIALRQEMNGERNALCRCDNRKVPYLMDMEFDKYLTSLPKTQLVILSVLASPASGSMTQGDVIIEKLYKQMNKNRSIPCVQSRHDPYRLFRYSISSNGNKNALLVNRHNVIDGMVMMYQGGKLLFANFIFDGYGSTKKDFMRQISRTRKEALKGRFLPEDFRFGMDTKTESSSIALVQQQPAKILRQVSSGVDDDQLLEEASSEKVIAGPQARINIVVDEWSHSSDTINGGSHHVNHPKEALNRIPTVIFAHRT